MDEGLVVIYNQALKQYILAREQLIKSFSLL